MHLRAFLRFQGLACRRRPRRSDLRVEQLEGRRLLSANIDVSNTAGPEVETNIDINPVNPQNLVATAIHGSLSQQPPPSPSSAFYSSDGGQSWNASSPLPLSVGGVNYRFSGDATVAFDSKGNVYVSYIAVDFTPHGLPIAIVVAKSSDGGVSFSQVQVVTSLLSNGHDILDHPKVAVDHDPSSPFHDTVYVSWIPEFSGQPSKVALSHSTDGGLTWSSPVTVENGNTPVQLNTQTVGPDGTLYVSYIQDDPAGHSTQFVASSTDEGATFSNHAAVTTLNALPAFDGEAFASPAQPNRIPGVSAIPAQVSLDTDRSAGPFRGRLYMAYIDRPDPVARPFDEDVYLQFSDDHGATWSPRQRVNDDGTGNSQFFPSLSVDPTNGKVLISWYDTRRDPVNIQLTDVFLAVGNPSRHGVHFRKNLRVTDQPSDESVNNPQAIGWYGDYEGIVAYGGVAHPVWSDARAANVAAGLNEEVYTASVRYADEEALESEQDGFKLTSKSQPAGLGADFVVIDVPQSSTTPGEGLAISGSPRAKRPSHGAPVDLGDSLRADL